MESIENARLIKNMSAPTTVVPRIKLVEGESVNNTTPIIIPAVATEPRDATHTFHTCPVQ